MEEGSHLNTGDYLMVQARIYAKENLLHKMEPFWDMRLIWFAKMLWGVDCTPPWALTLSVLFGKSDDCPVYFDIEV